MELNYLREFVLLAETLNFLEASERLFISQSTLTRHIQTMEKELGEPLLNRTSRKVTLTKFGQAFLPYAIGIARLQAQYTSRLLVARRREKKVVVCFSGALAPYNIAGLLSRFKLENPDIELEVIQSKNALASLLAEQCDFASSNDKMFPEAQFHISHFLTDRLVAVVAANHPLARKKEISLTELADEQLLLLRPCAVEGSAFLQACKAAAFLPNYRVTDGTNMIDLAAVGQCVAIMTRRPALFFAEDAVSVLEITPRIPFRSLLLHRKDVPLTAPEQRFLDFMEANRILDM